MKKTLRYVFVIFSLLLVLNQTYVYSDKLIKNNNSSLWGDNPPAADEREQQKFYRAYSAGLLEEDKITDTGWKDLYEYELKNGYARPDDIPTDVIKRYNIDTTVYKASLTSTTISEAEYKERQVKYYAAYKNGVIPKNNISNPGWKVIYEYELEQGYIYIEDVPQWAIDAYNIDLSVGKERGPQFYKYIPLLLLVIPLIYFRAWNRNKEVD